MKRLDIVYPVEPKATNKNNIIEISEQKEIPGVMEFIRIIYGTMKPSALLSRGVAGILGQSLIYTLPGSVRAVEEYMNEILKTLQHTIYMQYGIDKHN